MKDRKGRWWTGWLALVLVWGAGHQGAMGVGERVLYETRFEVGEGFDEELTLIGQGGWVGWGTGGNGLVNGFFSGEGQHAFVGFVAPTSADEFLNVWRPVNYIPGPTNPPVVVFSVLMSIEDSSSRTNRDDFRWSVYNRAGDRLFSLDFDNEALQINYLLDDDRFVSTGRGFTNSVTYALEVRMDFATNGWSATLDDVPLVTGQPLTTQPSTLDFGDVDAVWAIRQVGSAGDNYMVFDNYRLVVGEGGDTELPNLELLRLVGPGEALLRAHGIPGQSLVLQTSVDLQDWTPIKTNTVPEDGVFDHLDDSGGPQRYYRLRER
jgi:hypothetical protein